MSLVKSYEAYSDMSVYPGADFEHSPQFTWLTTVRLSLGAAIDEKAGPLFRRGICATFGPIAIPEAIATDTTIQILKAKLTLVPDNDHVELTGTSGYKLCSINGDGGWDSRGYMVGDTLYNHILDSKYRRESVMSVLVNSPTILGVFNNTWAASPIGNSVVAMLGGGVAAPSYKGTKYDASTLGSVRFYFVAASTGVFGAVMIRIFMDGSSGTPLPGNLIIKLYEVSGGINFDGGTLGTLLDTLAPKALNTLPSAMAEYLGPSVSSPILTLGQTYCIEFALDTDLPVDDNMFFDGSTSNIGVNSHPFTVSTRLMHSRHEARGYLGAPNSFHASTMPYGSLAQLDTNPDSSYVRMREDSGPPVELFKNVPVVWGNAGYSPDILVDLAAVLQDWIDVGFYSTDEFLVLNVIPLDVDAVDANQQLFFHSTDNILGEAGPTLEFEYEVIHAGASEHLSISDVDADPGAANAASEHLSVSDMFAYPYTFGAPMAIVEADPLVSTIPDSSNRITTYPRMKLAVQGLPAIQKTVVVAIVKNLRAVVEAAL